MSPLTDFDHNEILKNIIQIAVITDNFESNIQNLVSIFGIGPFKMFTYKLLGSKLYGQPQIWNCKIAIGYVGNVQWEVIQPLEGTTLNKRYLDHHGPGVHHFATEKNLDDYVEITQKLESELNQKLSQQASVCAVVDEQSINFSILKNILKEEVVASYSYIDTFDKLGLDIEIIGTDKKVPLSTLMRVTANSHSFPEDAGSVFESTPNSFIDEIVKINIATRDLDQYLETWKILGVNDWHVYKKNDIPYRNLNGVKNAIEKMAIIQIGQQRIEIQQPTKENNYLSNQLDLYGQGVHSIGIVSHTLNYDIAKQLLESKNIELITEGENNNGELFCLFNCQGLIGTNLELWKPSSLA